MSQTALRHVADAPSILLDPGQPELVIGRDRSTAQILIDHPSISRRHAVLTRAGSEWRVRDLGSTNGVFVNHQRLSGEARLTPGDVVSFGSIAFELGPAGLRPARAANGTAVGGRDIVVEVGDNHRRLLDSVSITLEPGKFVAVLGPSGCGKSTLIRVLSGRLRPTSGQVTVGGLDVDDFFDAIKQSLAFVPQRETLPDDLSLRAALRYTARLRLSADTTRDDVDRAVELGLSRVGMSTHADTRIGQLSGGQRKRAALANELIAQPAVVFADEVTSGLDDSTDREVMQLFRELAAGGITIVCVTHTVSNVADCCDDLVVMAPGGRVAYHGTPARALDHFGVTSLAGIYDRLESATVLAKGKRNEAGATPSRAREAVRTDRRMPLAQVPALAARAMAVTLANRRALAFVAAQSLLVGVLFRLVFGGGTVAEPMQSTFAFLLGIASFWFGCSNASKEIVRERGLYRLERDINLRIPSYILSKVVVLGAMNVAQVALLFVTMLIGGLGIPRVGPMFVANVAFGLVGVALGLAVSAYARREEQAASLVPIVLIPQLLLSTALVPQLSSAALGIAKGAVSAYWMHRANLDLLAATGPGFGEAALVFGAHGVIFAGLAGVILFMDQSAQQ